MESVWSVFLMFVLLATGATSYQETKLEDVVGEYEFRMFKNLFVNTTQRVIGAINRLENQAAKESSVSKLEDTVKEMQDAVDGLNENTLSVRDSVDDSGDGMKVEVRMLQDRMVEKLDELKSSVDLMTRRMDEEDDRLNLLSLNLMAQDCQDLYATSANTSGIYFLQKFGKKVLCDMEGGEGGWLVVQRRVKAAQQVDFNRDWLEYKAGFGELESEFWIGNAFLHVLTNQKTYEMKVEMLDYEKGAYWASYSSFRVGSEEDGYPLDLGPYTGNASDAFTYHHGRKFTSYDRDNDLYDVGNCATFFSGAWWYDRCYDAHLNGIYPSTPDRQNASFITWWAHEEGRKVPLVLTEVTVKVRPRQD